MAQRTPRLARGAELGRMAVWRGCCFNPAAMLWAVDTTYNLAPALWRALRLWSSRHKPGPIDLAIEPLRGWVPAFAGMTMGKAERDAFGDFASRSGAADAPEHRE